MDGFGGDGKAGFGIKTNRWMNHEKSGSFTDLVFSEVAHFSRRLMIQKIIRLEIPH